MLGFSLSGKYSLPMPEVVKLVHSTGFSAISPLWQRDVDLDPVMNTAAACGLTLQSLHGPLRGLPGMWSREESAYGQIRKDVLDSADACAAYGIPLLVIHSWTSVDYTFRQEDLYFGHFDALVDRACSKGFQIAFENLEGPEYLDALMHRYRDVPNVGLCWDSGHELCYAPARDFLADYGDRLIMTHLNDNFGISAPDGHLQGTDDLHLFPFDGNVDWEQTVLRLKQAKPQQILNFELKIRPKGDRCTTDLYSQLPLAQFFAQAYARAEAVASNYFSK